MHPSQTELETLAAELGQALQQRGEKMVSAESCTGGWLGQCCTANAGSSAWFDRGFISYSNDAKHELLGVSTDLLARQGAVCEATARAMASGALAASKAQWSLAITGIAGPTGGSAKRPVGTVWFAWAGPDGWVDATCCQFPGERMAVRAAAVLQALQGLLQRLQFCSPNA